MFMTRVIKALLWRQIEQNYPQDMRLGAPEGHARPIGLYTEGADLVDHACCEIRADARVLAIWAPYDRARQRHGRL